MRFLKRLFGRSSTPSDPQTPATETDSAEIRLVGAYRVAPTRKQMGDAALFFGEDHLVTKAGLIRAKEVSQHDLEDLVLIELEVSGPFSVDDVSCHVRNSEQSPYLEFYMSADGKELLYHPNRDDFLDPSPSLKATFDEVLNMTETRRICFFLHFVTVGATIRCKEAFLKVDGILEQPGRLDPYAHYLPVG